MNTVLEWKEVPPGLPMVFHFINPKKAKPYKQHYHLYHLRVPGGLSDIMLAVPYKSLGKEFSRFNKRRYAKDKLDIYFHRTKGGTIKIDSLD